jgi:hypothetical protein
MSTVANAGKRHDISLFFPYSAAPSLILRTINSIPVPSSGRKLIVSLYIISATLNLGTQVSLFMSGNIKSCKGSAIQEKKGKHVFLVD